MNDEEFPDENDARYPIPDAYYIKDKVFTSLRLFRLERVGEKVTRVGIHMRLNPATVGWADVHEHCGGGEYVAQPVNEKGHVKGSYTQSLAGESIPAERIFWPAHLVLPGSPRNPTPPVGETLRESVPSSVEPPSIRLERERMLLHEERLLREREWQERQAARDREERREREERERAWQEMLARREAEERRWREERDERERRWAEEREERRRLAELEREERIQRAAVERTKIEQEAMLQRERLKNEAHQSGILQVASVIERVASSIIEKNPQLLERIADRIYGEKAKEHAAEIVRQQVKAALPDLVSNMTDAALDEIARRPDVLSRIGKG